MPDLIASIFHLTDLHLSVDARGDLRKQLRSGRLLAAAAKRVPVPGARAVLAGAMWHNEEALVALCDDLPEILRLERDEAPDEAPVLVLQTGDVEALGSAVPAGRDGYDAFPSFAFVHSELRDAGDGWEWLDIYGNHDTWPGTYPPMRPRHRHINRKRIATVPGMGGPWPGDADVFEGATGIPVVVARVNSISRTLLEETLASGRITDHPPGNGDLNSVLGDLSDAFEPWRGKRAVRIAVLHHPPHVFEATRATELTTGRLEGAPEFAQRLGELGVQLVVAGHRHKLNPAEDVTSATPPDAQPPLGAPAVQLVAESPTQDSVAMAEDDTEDADTPPRSFCRYRLWADDASFAVERTVFSYTDIGGGAFSAEPPSTLFEGLPVE
jgi:hypothetical protein